MAFHIRDPETDRLARQAAERRGVGLTQAVKLALAADLARKTPEEKLAAMREIQEEIARLPKTGLHADKAFFDDLSGDAD